MGPGGGKICETHDAAAPTVYGGWSYLDLRRMALAQYLEHKFGKHHVQRPRAGAGSARTKTGLVVRACHTRQLVVRATRPSTLLGRRVPFALEALHEVNAPLKFQIVGLFGGKCTLLCRDADGGR